MAPLYVFSKTPLPCLPENVLTEREEFGGGYRYTIIENASPDAVADIVFSALTLHIAAKRLRGEKHILEASRQQLAETFAQKLSAYFYITGNKSKILELIRSLIAERGVIDIDGVAAFRLKEFSTDISAFFDLLFYEYNVRRKYDDFITLLRDYVSLESPREEAVHIVFSGRGFVLYNANKTNITYSALKNYNSDSNFSEGNLNDFLISSLLYYLPKTIIIHTDGGSAANAAIIETIRAVFKERAVCCEYESCELCAHEEKKGLSH